MRVYFCSRQWSTRSVSFACIFFVSTTTYQIFFIVSQIQKNVECRSNILLLQFHLYIFGLDYYPTIWDLRLYIFVLDNNLPDKIMFSFNREETKYFWGVVIFNLFSSIVHFLKINKFSIIPLVSLKAKVCIELCAFSWCWCNCCLCESCYNCPNGWT